MVTAKTQYNLKNAQQCFEDHLCVDDHSSFSFKALVQCEFLVLDFVVLPTNIRPVITHETNWRETHFRPPFWPIAVATFFLVTWTADASVTIATTDASSGKPLSEVQVVFRIGSVSHEGTTDTEGNCKMVGTNLADACITVQKEGWCPMKWDFTENPPENSTTFSFKMRRAAKIGGLVVDSRSGESRVGSEWRSD